MAPAFSKKQWALSHLLLGLLFFLALRASLQITQNELRVSFLDVGQGDAILIQTPEGRNILVDAGVDGGVVGELGKKLPFFRQKIDLFILTHPDRDHFAGFLDVLSKYPVKAMALTGVVSEDPLYGTMIEEFKKKGGVFVFPNNHGDLVIGKEIFLDLLYPFKDQSFVGQRVQNKNDTSLSMIIRQGLKPLVLLTGDAEMAQERELLLSGQDVHSDVYKAGHHGSRTSSTDAFLKAVSPRIVVISAGKENKFGHPHPEVMEKFEGLEIRRTDTEGTVTMTFEKKG